MKRILISSLIRFTWGRACPLPALFILNLLTRFIAIGAVIRGKLFYWKHIFWEYISIHNIPLLPASSCSLLPLSNSGVTLPLWLGPLPHLEEESSGLLLGENSSLLGEASMILVAMRQNSKTIFSNNFMLLVSIAIDQYATYTTCWSIPKMESDVFFMIKHQLYSLCLQFILVLNHV